MKQLRIYVAGPLTSHDKGTVKKNVERARKIGENIFRMGHLPYVPHTHFHGWDIDIHEFYDFFQSHGEDILERWAEALFFMGPSKGASAEKEKAERLGLRIFTGMKELKRFNEQDP